MSIRNFGYALRLMEISNSPAARVSLGKRIACFRRIKQLSAKKLADAVGTSRQTITKLECGDVVHLEGQLSRLLTICQVLGVTLDDLLA